MSFEETFLRIAVALEKIAASTESQVVSGDIGTVPVLVKAEHTDFSAAVKPPGRRGRPPSNKSVETVAEKVTEKEPEVEAKSVELDDNFLDEAAPAKPATEEQMRAALSAYSTKKAGKDGKPDVPAARKLFTKVTGKDLIKDCPPDMYALVIAAAEAS